MEDLVLSGKPEELVEPKKGGGENLGNIDHLLISEREKAARLSQNVAEFVLRKGTKKEDSVWYEWEIVDGTGNRLLLEVADVNDHGRDIKAIIKGGNQNDRLETSLRLFQGKGRAAGSTWSLPKKELTWLRAYPSLASLIGWSYKEWYTYFPSDLPSGRSKAETLKAYSLYNKYLEQIKMAVGSSQTPKFAASNLFLALAPNSK